MSQYKMWFYQKLVSDTKEYYVSEHSEVRPTGSSEHSEVRPTGSSELLLAMDHLALMDLIECLICDTVPNVNYFEILQFVFIWISN